MAVRAKKKNTYVLLLGATILDLYSWSSVRLWSNFEGPNKVMSHGKCAGTVCLPVLHIFLDLLVFELPTNQALERKDSV